MKSTIGPQSDVAKTLGMDQPSGRGSRLKRYLAVALLVGLGVITFTIIGWKATSQSNALQYKTQEVRRGNLTVIVTATGTLEPTNEVEVGSELSGIVESVEVNYNDRVEVNQCLARLDTSKLEAQVTQSKASLEAAKAKVLQAKATVRETRSKLAQFQKVRELSDNKVPSQSELDASEAAFERAKADEASAMAEVSQARATLEAVETDLSKTIIRSPINGVVLTRSVEPGQTVAASLQAPVLFTLAEDLTQMELHVDVDEADIGKVQEGAKAMFSVAAYPDRTFEARITRVHYGSSTTSGVVTYETVLKVDNSDLSLRPGMTATADITVQSIENAVLAPTAALRFTPPAQEEKKPDTGLIGALLPHPPRHGPKTGGDNTADKKQQRVWVLEDGWLSPIFVAIGSTDGSMSEVTAGDLEPGTALVVDTIIQEK